MIIEYENLTKEVLFRRYIIRTGKWHWHDNAELIRIANGCAEVTVGNDTYDMVRGDIIFVQSKQLHFFETDSDDCIAELCMISPAYLNKWLSAQLVLNPYIPCEEIKKSPELAREIDFIMSVLIRESEKNEPFHQEIMELEILHLCCVLARQFSSNVKMNSKRADFVYDILNYMSQNFDEKISLTSVAERYNYSSAYLSSLFSAYLGVGFKKHLDQIRVAEAKRMMISTDLSITNIALKCGFDSVRTFNNRFKAITKITPSEFIGRFSPRGKAER